MRGDMPLLLRSRERAARLSITLRACAAIASDADLDELHDLEAAMWRSETRGDRSWMERHLARDFTEFGRSGRRYTRAEIRAVEVGEIHATLPLRDLQCRRLGGVSCS